jgi:DNA-binding transcriptional LysR family regulator
MRKRTDVTQELALTDAGARRGTSLAGIDLAAVPRIGTRDMLMVLAVAEHTSFIAAAAYLKTTQPVVTRGIGRAERVLGVTLFDRTTRRVEITLAGREFVAVAERALGDLQNTVRSMTEAASEQRGRVTIATFSAVATHRLPDLIRQFRSTRPHVEVWIREGRQTEIVEHVRTGAADFGIGFVESLPDTLTTRLLRHEPLYALLPLTHPLATARPRRLGWGELRDQSLVSLSPETHLRRLIDGAAATHGCSLRHQVVVDTLVGVVDHVNAGGGIGILPAGALPPQPGRRFHAVLVEPSASVAIGLITATGRYLSRLTTTMLALVTDDANAPELWRVAR